jgi:hypothetical protein
MVWQGREDGRVGMAVRTWCAMGCAVVLLGCPPPDPLDIDPVDSDDTEQAEPDRPFAGDTDDPLPGPVLDTGDEEGPLPLVDPAVFILLATFGYDALTGEAVPYTFGLNTYDPALDIIAASAGWDGDYANTDAYCLVKQTLTGVTPPSVLFDPFPDVLFGYAVPEDAPVAGGCAQRLDSTLWGDFQQDIADWSWGVAVKAEVDANYREQLLAANVYTEADFDWVIGGGFAGTMAQSLSNDGFFEVAITQGLHMDASHTLLVDERGVPIPMRVEEMVVDGELQTGRYFLQITLDWVAVSLVP